MQWEISLATSYGVFCQDFAFKGMYYIDQVTIRFDNSISKIIIISWWNFEELWESPGKGPVTSFRLKNFLNVFFSSGRYYSSYIFKLIFLNKNHLFLVLKFEQEVIIICVKKLRKLNSKVFYQCGTCPWILKNIKLIYESFINFEYVLLILSPNNGNPNTLNSISMVKLHILMQIMLDNIWIKIHAREVIHTCPAKWGIV